MEKIKVLHITQAVIGGTLEYIKLFFNNIDVSKFEVELICPSYGPMKQQIEALGFNVYTVEMKRKINLVSDLSSYIQVSRLIKKIKPDIIHIHSSKAGVIGRIAAYRNKIPNVYNPHGWSFSMDISNRKKNMYAFIEKKCSKYCNFVINISDEEQKLALKYNICSENKMKTIYNGIDLTKYDGNFNKKQILKELCIPEDSYVIGMVARLSKQKSPKTFLAIAAKLHTKIRNAYFILVGDGELMSELNEMIDTLGIRKNIRITGWTNRVNQYISVFDVGILTSKWEGFGLVLAEYMASMKPVIASNVGGIPNVIKDNYNGRLIYPDDIEGFCDAIISIKNNVTLREKYVKNGYDVVRKKFNIKRVIDEHEKLYLEILNRCCEDD